MHISPPQQAKPRQTSFSSLSSVLTHIYICIVTTAQIKKVWSKNMMKQNLYFLLLFLVVSMLMSSQVSARFLLANNQEKGEVKLHKTIGGDFNDKMETSDDSNKLMGEEKCDDGDEECFKRRIIVEAHLDYIYTQHHNHP